MNYLNTETEHRCVKHIASNDDWLVRIGHRFINLNYLRNEDQWNGRVLETSHFCTDELIFPAPQPLEKSLYNIIEENPINSFNYIERESIKTQVLIPRMALFLSARTIETICDQIFSKIDINETFVELIYEYFFSIYLKRVYSWSSLHMLIKASKAYPKHFLKTLKILFKDISIPNNILLDYVETLNAKSCTNLLKYISQFPFNLEEFNHNTSVLHLLYKKCDKNEDTFQYIQSNLEMYNQSCAHSKKYGRLLLCFIENLSGFNVRIRFMKKIIENHCTSYKSPCMAALEKYVMDIIALQLNFHDGPRIVIPRPSEDFQL